MSGSDLPAEADPELQYCLDVQELLQEPQRVKLPSSVRKVELGNHTTEWKWTIIMDRIEDLRTASGQESRLPLAAFNTISELERVVKNDQPPRLNLSH